MTFQRLKSPKRAWHVIGEAMEGVNGGGAEVNHIFLHFMSSTLCLPMFFFSCMSPNKQKLLCPGVFVGCEGVSPTLKWFYVGRRECTQDVCKVRVYNLPGAPVSGSWFLRVEQFPDWECQTTIGCKLEVNCHGLGLPAACDPKWFFHCVESTQQYIDLGCYQ